MDLDRLNKLANLFIKLATNNWLDEKVPENPGTTKIPSNHIRLYHYLRDNSLETITSIKNNGILLSHSMGASYGEPKYVWASTIIPEHNKVFVEFSVPVNDNRLASGYTISSDKSPEEYYKIHSSVAFKDSILPSEIISIHEPWHPVYNRIISGESIFSLKDILSEKVGQNISDDKYSKAFLKIKHDFQNLK